MSHQYINAVACTVNGTGNYQKMVADKPQFEYSGGRDVKRTILKWISVAEHGIIAGLCVDADEL
jgi:hypothetical protein